MMRASTALRYLLICTSMVMATVAIAQQKYAVISHIQQGQRDNDWLKIDGLQDSVTILSNIQTIKAKGIDEGYSLIQVDSLLWSKDSCEIFWYQGDRYEIREIGLDPDARRLIDLAGLQSYKWKGKTVDSLMVSAYMNKLVDYLARHGYPFANLHLADIQFDQGAINANLAINKGPEIVFDTLAITGQVNISRSFMQRYTGITKGELYDHQLVTKLSSKLRSLQFLDLAVEPIVSFVNQQARIQLPLKPKRASRFDFIVGVLPTIEEGRRVWNVNGEFAANFVNKLGRGESFSIEMKRLKVDDQLLRSQFSYPYILNSNFGVDASFELKNNRNISVDLNTDVGSQYIIDGNSYIKVSWNYKSSSLLAIDTAKFIQLGELPSNLDFNFSGGGIEYFGHNLDYRFNPRKGNESRLNFKLGLRNIVRNVGLEAASTEDVDFVALYDEIKSSNLQFELGGEVHQYFPVSTFGALKTSLRAKWIYNDGELLINELYRIGGNQIMRGFDELTFQTDLYAVATAEMRIILDQNSYLSFPFVDVGRIRSRIERETTVDTAIGLGLGMNFSTAAGIFNISFAAGGKIGQGIDFANTKIHFGYVSLF